MDDLIQLFKNSDTALPKNNERSILYKKGLSVKSHKERVEEFIEKQKEFRTDHLLKIRGLIDANQKNINKNGFWKKYSNKNFYHQLMIAEIFFEFPCNLDEWFVVPCPKGKRCLVISSNNKTKTYTNNGLLLATFNSNLPGGYSPYYQSKSIKYHDYDTPSKSSDFNHENTNINTSKRNDCAILDCIYVPQIHTYYILDVMAWNCQSFYDCDPEFRQYWINSKLQELNETPKALKQQECLYNFKPLKWYGPNIKSSDQLKHILLDENAEFPFIKSDDLTNKIQIITDRDFNSIIHLQGILLLHKQSHYMLPTSSKVSTNFKNSNISENLEMMEEEILNEDEIDNPLVGWMGINILQQIF